jgi:hypothetical protein
MLKNIVLALTLALTPGLALAGNSTQTVHQEWWSVKQSIDLEIGFTGAVATVWDCNYSACERRRAEWYLPEKNLYVRWDGYQLTQGTVCEALDGAHSGRSRDDHCAMVARLTGGERPVYRSGWR